MPNKSNFSMPGPDFGNGKKNYDWLKQHWRKIIFAAFIALMAIGAGSFYKDYQTRTSLLKPVLENISPQASPTISIIAQTNEKVKGAAVYSAAPTAINSNGQITVTAAKGNGTTHLARQALKEYLKDKPELAQKLGAEQRIFIEDYLRKHLNQELNSLHVGDQISFSNNDLESAINLALALNDSQIENLSQYVSLIPSLMTP